MAAEIHTEGIQWLLEVAFTEEQAVPASFYIGLATDAALAEDASLGDQTEVTGTGYARVAVASDNTDLTSAGAGTNDYKVTTKQVTFTATGDDWDDANTAFLATTLNDTGKLVASAPLSETRSLLNGDSLKVTMVVQVNG